MHFLRFGSSIPGPAGNFGWGCCACDIIQSFKYDPDEPASIEVVSGDSGDPIGDKFLGKTYREIFESRIRIGTFFTDDMPNHVFLAILTESQLQGEFGPKWLKILKEHGFEFIRSFDNSVYNGKSLKKGKTSTVPPHTNYLFGLFRNIGRGAVDDPFEPPAEWTNLEGGVNDVTSFLSKEQREELIESRDTLHREMWYNVGPAKFYKREQLEKEGVPVWLAGRRSQNPQELASFRESRQSLAQPAKAAPFAKV